MPGEEVRVSNVRHAGECSMGMCSYWIVHTVLCISNHWSGMYGGAVGWINGRNDGCS